MSFKDNIGTREQLYPLLKNGTIDLYGEFTGSLLTYLKGNPTGDQAATYARVASEAAGPGWLRPTPATAQDVNGFYVTKATADKYKLVTMSDLTKTTVTERSTASTRCSAYRMPRVTRTRATSRARPIRRGAVARCRSWCRGRDPGARAFRPAA